MPITLPPLNLTTAIVDGEGFPTRFLQTFLQGFLQRISDAPTAVVNLPLAAQQASIGLSSLVTGAAGDYRVSWKLILTQAATTSSSVAVAVTTTDGGITRTQTGAAMTTNTLASVLSGSFIVSADQGTAITYSTTYASVGATPAIYTLVLIAELLS